MSRLEIAPPSSEFLIYFVFRITPCDPRVAVDTKRGGKTGGTITTQHCFD